MKVFRYHQNGQTVVGVAERVEDVGLALIACSFLAWLLTTCVRTDPRVGVILPVLP